LHKYGKDKYGNQKYLCKTCYSQFAPTKQPKKLNKYPRCPKCSKATYIWHRYDTYVHFKCGNKKCNHSFKKPIAPPKNINNQTFKKLSKPFKNFRFPPHLIFTVLNLYFDCNVSSRKIKRFIYKAFGVKVSHVTICEWTKHFSDWFLAISKDIFENLDLASDEWHVDETFIKIKGITHYLWILIDSETRVIISYILSDKRDSSSAYELFYKSKIVTSNKPLFIVSDNLDSYNFPISFLLENSIHHKYKAFSDYLNNNFIESFNKTFKDWYKTKKGFKSFSSAQSLITGFIFHYNFLRPHSSLNNMTPAEVAGATYNENKVNNWFLS